jgi:hypothetical protein
VNSRMLSDLLRLFVVSAGVAALLATCGGSKSGFPGSPPNPDGDVQPGLGGEGGEPGGGGGVGVIPGGGGALAGAGGGTASSCGDPGVQCCGGNSCNDGGCCVSGICMAVGGSCVGLGGGTCNNGTCGTCGAAGLPCCVAASGSGVCTAPETRCTAGTCATCGALGGPCCESAAGGAGTCKGAGAICSSGVCIACGTPGSPCCPGNECSSGCCYNSTCLGEGTTCGTNGGTCQAGRCSGCGGAGQTCCATLCYDGLMCKSGACAACGGSGQACCPAGGTTPPCQSGMACVGNGSDGVCARCGSLGDTCCAGNTCTDGCCSNNRCVVSTTGACGTGGSGGSPGTGGVTGSGGVIGTGGVPKTGGITSAGGVTNTGGIVSTGGIISTGGTTSTDGCDALIDDMESGTGLICKTRKGAWYTYIDSDSYSSISPLPGSAALPELMATSRTTSSSRAMHISGSYLTYAGLACWLNNASFVSIPGTYNASGYTGIKFYAKGKGSLIVVGQMPSTEKIEYGGTCPYTSCAGNQYAAGTLSSSWTLYTVPFTYLKGGSATPFSPSTIWSLEFMFYSGTSLTSTTFDLWVDDLTFY